MPALFLLLAYLVVVLAPLAFAWTSGMPARPFLDELSTGLALVAFAAMLVEFVLSGRFRAISNRIGMDVTMRFHQLFARSVVVLVLLHPFLYTTPIMAYPPPWDVTAQGFLGLEMESLITGLLAWILLIVIVVTAIGRDALPYSYETWRLGHGMGSVLLAGFSTHHALEAGRYSSHEALSTFWLILLGLSAASLLYVYLVSPLLRLRSPYKVRSVRRIAERTWELAIAPADGKPLSFEAGQFVWLNIGPSPFSLRENPFSISSAPASGDRVEFLIKEVGDFTRSLGTIQPGARAWIDGPHGSLAIPGPDAPGIGLIAGGVGVAPLLSILREMRATGDRRPVALLYGNRTETQIAYREELEQLEAEPNVTVRHVLSEPPAGWQGFVGGVNTETTAATFDRFDDANRWTYLLCGPPGMIDSAETALVERGVPSGSILSERFVYD
ncbi:ferredoxin reductase family protein [Nisaea acidiphila]|uniref:Ferredoxin reductase family protein n=1 Tax=Nisaea acidiphila TaxID=1862145 RepID=A0A9J7APC5_9PROT|nr:ferredoxin reductase family protein [Nisaea acidiphila]UUX49264.1 ferredoxin reductase family protein [Nisaea acidiphila]